MNKKINEEIEQKAQAKVERKINMDPGTECNVDEDEKVETESGTEMELEEELTRISSSSRQCYICLETVAKVEEHEELDWVSPCRCAGSLAWVHSRCLLRWVREREGQHPGMPPSCPQCLTRFRLHPEKGRVVALLETFDKRVYPLIKLTAGCVITGITFDAACIAIGLGSLIQIYGMDEVEAMVKNGDPIHTVSLLHVVSYGLLVLNYIPWEDYLLSVLRAGSRLPILRAVLPADAPKRYHGYYRRQSLWRTAVGGLLLPAVGKIVGAIFFKSVESDLNRVLLGGATYLAVRGGLYMYYKQKMMLRRQQMVIFPYDED